MLTRAWPRVSRPCSPASPSSLSNWEARQPKLQGGVKIYIVTETTISYIGRLRDPNLLPGQRCADAMATASNSPIAVALVLHGKIGLWTLRSSDVPAGDLRSTRYSCGRSLCKPNPLQANAMVAPPKTPVRASNVSLWQLERWPHSLRIGFARFASRSILRHVVDPNRARGVRIDVFLHSWHPEIGRDLDALYAPAASQHEPVQPIHKVASQHLSMKRGLALAATHPQRHDLVMVARYDLLFFSELLFGAPPSSSRHRIAACLCGAAAWMHGVVCAARIPVVAARIQGGCSQA